MHVAYIEPEENHQRNRSLECPNVVGRSRRNHQFPFKQYLERLSFSHHDDALVRYRSFFEKHNKENEAARVF